MALKVEHENRTRLSQSGFRSPSARHHASSDCGWCEGMLQCFRWRRTPTRGRNNCRLQPNVFSYRSIKPPRVHIDQYFARKEISRQESSGYRNVAITARTRSPSKRLTNCIDGRNVRCNQSKVSIGSHAKRASRLSQLWMYAGTLLRMKIYP
jgi:hypothetical protein